jgi:hypothetical protein
VSQLRRAAWRLLGDGRVATLASGIALVAGAARATGQHPAPGGVPAWVGIGLGVLGLVTVAGAIANGGER